MKRLTLRTSITVDEAVYILLGRSTGPIEMYPLDTDCEEAWAERPLFHLQDQLEADLNVLEGEYDRAKYENQPEEAIAKISAAIKREEALIDQADLYHFAIEDELNKGEQSALRVDRALSNAAYTFITMHSFNQWRASLTGEQPVAVVPTESVPPSPEGTEQKVVRDKGIRQGEAILAEIRNQKFDPKAVPKNRPGRRGVKWAVRRALKNSPLFKGSKVFDRAWQKLRNDGYLADQANSPPRKKTMGETSGGG